MPIIYYHDIIIVGPVHNRWHVSMNSAITPGIRDEIKDVPQDGSNDVPVELVVLDVDPR